MTIIVILSQKCTYTITIRSFSKQPLTGIITFSTLLNVFGVNNRPVEGVPLSVANT